MSVESRARAAEPWVGIYSAPRGPARGGSGTCDMQNMHHRAPAARRAQPARGRQVLCMQQFGTELAS